MWKELISTIYQKVKQPLKPWLEWVQAPPLCEQLELLWDSEILKTGEVLEWRLSDPHLVTEMERIEHDAYQGVTMWRGIDFYEDMVYNARSFYLQGLIDEELIAFVGVRRDAKDVHISNFVVRPDWQSVGIGSSVLHQLQELLPDLERDTLTLEVRESNVRAQRFYQRHGFVVERLEKNYYANNHENAYWMTYQSPDVPVTLMDTDAALGQKNRLRIRKKNENDHNFSY
ncbi:MAG: ribosomal protein S18-alanine N-acetyltransferase [Aerococcus sp.]|nr:ribosomal protein S18-alanine N-acetyltransferase [Aerococcus sp.]